MKTTNVIGFLLLLVIFSACERSPKIIYTREYIPIVTDYPLLKLNTKTLDLDGDFNSVYMNRIYRIDHLKDLEDQFALDSLPVPQEFNGIDFDNYTLILGFIYSAYHENFIEPSLYNSADEYYGLSTTEYTYLLDCYYSKAREDNKAFKYVKAILVEKLPGKENVAMTFGTEKLVDFTGT